MRRLGDILPLPGMPELEGIARGLVERLKELKYEDEKEKILTTRLESLINCAKQLDDLSELHIQLSEIQNRFEMAVKSKSRLDIRRARSKLALWEELNSMIDNVIAATMLRQGSQLYKAQVRRQVAKSSENKLPVIPSHEILDQVELYRRDPPKSCQCEECVMKMPLSEPIIVSCRTGRYGKLTVTYKTFSTRSGAGASPFVEAELAQISRFLHPNVVGLAGITQGYRGLDGFIFVTNGLPVDQFLSQVSSGAAMAKYVECLLSVVDAYGHILAEAITIQKDGRAMVVPSENGSTCVHPTCIGHNLHDAGKHDMTPAMLRLTQAITTNLGAISKHRLQPFLAACRNLGCAFTELEVMRLAASSGLFPDNTSHYFNWNRSQPDYLLRPGDFGIAKSQTTDSGTVEHSWTPLGGSFCPEGWDTTTTGRPFGGAMLRRSKVDGAQWLSYDLASCRGPDGRIRLYISLDFKSDSGANWDDIETRAQDLALDKGVDIESVSWCTSVQCNVLIDPQQVHDASQAVETLYFHRSDESTDPLGFWGFLSISADPSCHASRETIEQRGWSPTYQVFLQSYDLSQAWARQHDRMLEEGLATIPGSYPGAHIDEVE